MVLKFTKPIISIICFSFRAMLQVLIVPKPLDAQEVASQDDSYLCILLGTIGYQATH